jgi:hypothetical protein
MLTSDGHVQAPQTCCRGINNPQQQHGMPDRMRLLRVAMPGVARHCCNNNRYKGPQVSGVQWALHFYRLIGFQTCSEQHDVKLATAYLAASMSSVHHSICWFKCIKLKPINTVHPLHEGKVQVRSTHTQAQGVAGTCCSFAHSLVFPGNP